MRVRLLRVTFGLENAFGHDAETEVQGTHLGSPLAGIRPTVAHSSPPSPQAAAKAFLTDRGQVDPRGGDPACTPGSPRES